MKKTVLLTVLGVAAVAAAYIGLTQMPQNPASSGANRIVHDTRQVVENAKNKVKQKAAPTAPGHLQGSIHDLSEMNPPDKVAPSSGGNDSSNADMRITTYVPTLHDMSYTGDDGTAHMLHVEIVSKPEELRQGLMFRHEMPEDQGMLFVFPGEGERVFWMKNTYIPLDMIFIRTDGTVQSVHKGAVPLDITRIPSHGPAQYVLEVNAGLADKFGIKAGDRLHSEKFAN